MAQIHIVLGICHGDNDLGNDIKVFQWLPRVQAQLASIFEIHAAEGYLFPSSHVARPRDPANRTAASCVAGVSLAATDYAPVCFLALCATEVNASTTNSVSEETKRTNGRPVFVTHSPEPSQHACWTAASAHQTICVRACRRLRLGGRAQGDVDGGSHLEETGRVRLVQQLRWYWHARHTYEEARRVARINQ